MTLDYLRQSLFFFRNHANKLALIQVPFLALVSIVQYQLLQGIDEETAQVQRSLFLSSALDLALMPVYWGATLLYLRSVLDGQPFTISQALIAGLGCWGRLLLTYILTALAISTGLLLFIVPGIYIGIRLAFAEFYCVMEGKGPIESIGASWASTREFFWPLFQGLALIIGLLLATELALGQLLAEQQNLMMLVSLVVQFLGVVPTIFAYRLYCVMKEDNKPA
ncbi:hypothetical protein H9C73_13570 [Marinobacterium sp. AK62]|uniref:Glycerophosphoryl diester phosphodiesterase membrane domain-containing protein n=1 Tax=Marinobacterium alkalitolerans TaxID=1542925 RepID=A0ABS3ZDH5_9GAMM|nr:hypothetical protein [Marinobacterium alkalitolerans]MBP0049761.1 hypothetical protein [Marinobacterium alkalitolerans]